MKNKVNVAWQGNMSFESDVDGYKIPLDADTKGKGPKPKPLMLAALAGCTAMDIVAILKKMRVNISDLNVSVEGELTDGLTKTYKAMHVIYEVTGKNIPLKKVKKAVELSEEIYCGVSALYKKVIPITSEIKIIEE